jgi:hypothetical protein
LKIRDRLYELVARNRFRLFGRRATCYVPSPEFRDRFLDESVASSGEATDFVLKATKAFYRRSQRRSPS